MRKLITLALLVSLLPIAAIAQSSTPPKRPSGNKSKWLSVGSIAGGVGLIFLGTASGKQSGQTSVATSRNPPCVGQVTAGGLTTCTNSGFGIGGSVASAALTATPASWMSIGASSGNFFTAQERGTNWKVVGPAIGAVGVGIFVLYRSHVNTKSADLSVRPNGAVQLSYKW